MNRYHKNMNHPSLTDYFMVLEHYAKNSAPFSKLNVMSRIVLYERDLYIDIITGNKNQQYLLCALLKKNGTVLYSASSTCADLLYLEFKKEVKYYMESIK